MRGATAKGWLFVAVGSYLAGCGAVLDLGPERQLAEGQGGNAGSEAGGSDAGGSEAGGGGSAPIGLCDLGGDVMWLRTFGDASYDGIFGLAPDGEDGVYLSGWFSGALDLGGGPMQSAGDRDFFVARLDGDGELVWNQRYGTPYLDDTGPAVARHPGGVALCGSTGSPVDFGGGLHLPNGYDHYVVLLAEDGSHRWETWIDGPGEQRCWGELAVDEASGDIFVGTRFNSQASSSRNTSTRVGEVLVWASVTCTGTVKV